MGASNDTISGNAFPANIVIPITNPDGTAGTTTANPNFPNAGKILTRAEILKTLCSLDYDGVDRSVDNRIYRVRKRLGDTDFAGAADQVSARARLRIQPGGMAGKRG